jgi:pseudouridine-5'-phosphate glycosidase
MDTLIGAIAIETSAGLATVMEVDAETDAEAAVMVAAPCPELVARP